MLDESHAQIAATKKVLSILDPTKVTTILAHLVCQILLNKAGEWIGELNEQGLLHDQEAEHFLEEIQHDIDSVNTRMGEWVLLPCRGEDDPEDATLSIEKITDLHQKKLELEAVLKAISEQLALAEGMTTDDSKNSKDSVSALVDFKADSNPGCTRKAL